MPVPLTMLLAAAQGPNPLVPSLYEVLMWVVAAGVVALLVTALVSLSRSPLDAHRQLPWAIALFILPVIGPAVWLWWRFSYYPKRKAEQPGWDPNDRTVVVNPPRRPVDRH